MRRVFFVGGSVDLLLQCAMNYEKLLDVAYNFTIARKGIVRKFTLTFQKMDFHHIAGLHKLTDTRQVLRGTRECIFDKIVQGAVSQKLIEESDLYTEMSARLAPLCHLEEVLDNDNLIFKYNENVRVYSKIKSDYLLEGLVGDLSVYLFLGNRNENDESCQMCRTFFPKSTIDYSIGQPKYTLLRKEKIRVSSGEILLRHERA